MTEIEQAIENIVRSIELFHQTVETNSNKNKKKIQINDTVQYVSIPNRYELMEENVKGELWWTVQEMSYMKYTASYEINVFLELFPNNDYNTLAKQLWLVLDFDEIYKNQVEEITNYTDQKENEKN